MNRLVWASTGIEKDGHRGVMNDEIDRSWAQDIGLFLFAFFLIAPLALDRVARRAVA
jgi:hypothetical protein